MKLYSDPGLPRPTMSFMRYIITCYFLFFFKEEKGREEAETDCEEEAEEVGFGEGRSADGCDYKDENENYSEDDTNE